MKQLFQSSQKYLFLGFLILLFCAFSYFHAYDYLNLKTLKLYQATVQQWTNQHYDAAVAIYILIFIVLVACAIPCATLLTIFGGFLFGNLAVIYAPFSITLGGMLLFLAIRTALGARIANNSSGWIKKFEQGFQNNAFSYLLTLRLIPIFPCWVSNIAAGMLNMPLRSFLFATLIGIFPATFIYVMAGRSLDTLLADTSLPLTHILLIPSVLFPLIGLGILSLLPIIYKAIKK